MDEHNWLVQRFEEHPTHQRAGAYRMLGSLGEADDAVQEAWLRVGRVNTDGVENSPAMSARASDVGGHEVWAARRSSGRVKGCSG
jgi:hypothetical protein